MITTEAVLRDLEEIKNLFDSPTKSFRSTLSYDALSTPKNHDVIKTYTHALSSAEKSVDRLGRAIEDAEDEMEAALRRTTEVYKVQLRQKELELFEAQQDILKLQKSLESARASIADLKDSYESKLSNMQSAILYKDGELARVEENLNHARAELLNVRLDRDAVTSVQTRLAEANKSIVSDSADLRSAMNLLRKEKEFLKLQNVDLQREVTILGEELQQAKRESSMHVIKDVEVLELRKRLRAERMLRKACEKWLRAEMKSKDEVEHMLATARELAFSKAYAETTARETEQLISSIRQLSPRATTSPPDHAIRRLEDDNTRLRSELLTTKRLLQDNLR